MTITHDQRALTYAKQRGVPVGTPMVADETMTVAQLRSACEKIGLRTTSKDRKGSLISAFNAANKRAVDLSKLTARQRRRLRKRGDV